MQFKTEAEGYTVSEIYRLESARKLLKLDGKATLGWSNSNRKDIDKDTLGKYFALVGQEFWNTYKKTVKSWEKAAQSALDKAEKAVIVWSLTEEKKLKKAGADQAKVDAAQKQALTMAEAEAKKIQADIQTSYETLLVDLAKKAHLAVVKKLGNAAGSLKKHHGKAAFKVLMFAVAVAAVVLASIALGPLGGVALGIGIAAVVIKSVSVLSKGFKDLRGYIKEWNKVSEKAAAEIDAATAAVEKAVTAMDACNSVRQSLQLKIAGLQKELDTANGGLDPSDKKIASLKKKVATAKAELQALEKFIGDNTGDLLKHLQAAQKTMTTAKSKKPKKFMGPVETLMDFVDGVGELAA